MPNALSYNSLINFIIDDRVKGDLNLEDDLYLRLSSEAMTTYQLKAEVTSSDAPIELKKGSMEYSFLQASEQDNYYISLSSLSDEVTVNFRLEKVRGQPTLLLHECPSTDMALCRLDDPASALAKSSEEWLTYDLKPQCSLLPAKDYLCQLGVAVQGPAEYYLHFDVQGAKVVLTGNEQHRDKL